MGDGSVCNVYERLTARNAAKLRPWAGQFPYLNGGLFGNATKDPGSPRPASGRGAGGEGVTLRNWLIGLHIVEYEQGGADRAQYGTQLLNKVSVELERLTTPIAASR